MPTSATIRAALVSAIGGINGTGNYASTINPSNVFDTINPEINMESTSQDAYPRVLVYSEGAKYEGLPSYRTIKHETFSVVIILSQAANSTANIADAVAQMILDFETMIYANLQVGGSDSVELKACADDLGASVTQAVIVFELEINYRYNFMSRV